MLPSQPLKPVFTSLSQERQRGPVPRARVRIALVGIKCIEITNLKYKPRPFCLETVGHYTVVFYSKFLLLYLSTILYIILTLLSLLYILPYTYFVHIYIYIQLRAEYFLIPDDAVDRRKLGFQFYFLNRSLRPHLNNIMHAEFHAQFVSISRLTHNLRHEE